MAGDLKASLWRSEIRCPTSRTGSCSRSSGAFAFVTVQQQQENLDTIYSLIFEIRRIHLVMFHPRLPRRLRHSPINDKDVTLSYTPIDSPVLLDIANITVNPNIRKPIAHLSVPCISVTSTSEPQVSGMLIEVSRIDDE